MEQIIISDEDSFNRIKKKIQKQGPDKFHVLADFDRTLTKAYVNGEEVPSIISVLRSEGYLTPDYPAQAQALFDQYHQIEIDPLIPEAEKKSAMQEWWTKHFELLIQSGLSRQDIEQAVKSQKLQLRAGAAELLAYLHKKNIPLVIMSSSGLGVESISYYLKNQNLLTDNIQIISNQFIWDESGRAITVKEPIIHTLNKAETMVRDFPFYRQIKERTNVLLLGDSPEDIGMIEGFAYDNLIKIGFLNKNIEQNLELYRNKYDVVITGDSEMTFVFNLLKELFG